MRYIILALYSVVVFLFSARIGRSAGVGKPNQGTPSEGQNIEFLYIGEGNTFLAKVGSSSTMYYTFKFSGEQPKVGKYRIVGIGQGKRELLPLPDLVEVTK
jgi:hypothetical protein